MGPTNTIFRLVSIPHAKRSSCLNFSPCHYPDAHGGPGYIQGKYFLSSVITPSGATALALSYQSPAGLSCQQGLTGTSSGVPYLYELTSPEAQVRFQYAALSQADGGGQCVIRKVGIAASDGGIEAASAATYTYSWSY